MALTLGIGLVVALGSLCVSFAAPHAAPHSALRVRMTRELDSYRERDELPGISAALVLRDGTVVAVARGFADVEAERRLTTDDLMLSGSVGKTWFAAAALRLAARDELDLDASVADLVPGRDWFGRLPNADTMTVRHLLRHQTGLPRYVFDPAFWRIVVEQPDETWTPKERLRFVFDTEALHPAGEGWAYSDTNYIVLGLVLEELLDEPVEAHVRREFIEPLRLRGTRESNQRAIRGLTQGYAVATRQLGVPERLVEDGEFVFNPQFEWCGGGYANTPTDLARWAKLLFSGEAFAEEDRDILEDMLETEPAPMLGEGARYGLGVIERDTELGRSLGHDGFMTGFRAVMAYWPEHGVAAAVQINTDAAPSEPLLALMERLASAGAQAAR